MAERLGIPTATLRSWNRRYGVGPRQDRPGRHRLYDEADIAVLTRMLELISAGSTPARAAAAARGPVPAFADVAGLLDTAFTLETGALCDLLEQHLRTHGVVETWDRLCRPAFAAIVDRQLDGEGCVDVEHALSWSIITALHRTAHTAPVRRLGPIVLACTSGESHSLPLEVLRAALAERGVSARMLGPDVPTFALVDTLARIPSHATVVLWSQQEGTALTSAVRACADVSAQVYIAGPGWDTVLLPGAPRRLNGLTDALDWLDPPVGH